MNTLWLTIVDANFQPVPGATVHATTPHGPLNLEAQAGGWVGCGPAHAPVRLCAGAPGFEPEIHTTTLRTTLTPVILGLRRPGQIAYTYGPHRLAFAPMPNAFLLHIWGQRAAEVFAPLAARLSLNWQPVLPQPMLLQAAPTPNELFLRVDEVLEKGYALAVELRRQQLRVTLARIIQDGVVVMR